jgi:hypothetical protein
MPEPRAQRTLVKSPPELWAEVSDLEALARHLGEFGEIRITRTEPETTVAWEGDRARGTVHLEPSGWGTKVTLTAELAEPEPAPAPLPAEPEAAESEAAPLRAEPEPQSEPLPAEPEMAAPEAEAAVPEAEPLAAEPEAAEAEPPRVGFFARLFGRRRKPEPLADEPLAAEPEPEAEPVAADPEPEPVVAELEPEPLAASPEPEPVAVEPEPLPAEPEPEVEPDVGAIDGERAQAILTGVLDDLGSAHHRPFSRG